MKNVVVVILIVILIVVGILYFNKSETGDSVTESENNSVVKDDHHEEGDSEDYEIYPGKVVEKIQNNEDIILLDVRTPEEHAEIHIENSLLLPVGEISANTLADIGLGEGAKDKEIILYCRSGSRSKQAYDVMSSLGYTNLKSVSGGIVHWEEDRYPFTESGEYEGGSTNGNATNGTSAKVSFDKLIHNFGDVPQSEGVIETTFTLKNDGQETLEIGELSTSCGCTTADIVSKSIEPGGTTEITVFFDPNFHEEPADELTRTVFIPTNDPNTPEAEVKIKVDILEGE